MTGARLMGRTDGNTDGLGDDTNGDALTIGDTDGLCDDTTGDALPAGDTDGLCDDTTGDALTAGDTDGLGDDTTGDALTTGDTDGTTLGFTDGVADADDTGLTLGLCDGLAVGYALTNPLPWRVHVPQLDELDDTRVPVTAEYVPVSPTIVIRDPVTAPAPPPDVHFAVVANASHEPWLPLADVSYDRLDGGLPTPTYAELDVNRQPALQIVHALGQSTCNA